MKLLAFTLDLESEYSGCINQYEIFKKTSQIEGLLRSLEFLGIKTTVFVVGRIIEQFPDVIQIFEKYGCEFEAHSYTHNLLSVDPEYEIKKAKSAYFNYFGKYPIGYRAPRGKISSSSIGLLEKHGFLYDSSIFPSYFPNPLRYLFCKRGVHYFKNSNILEFPLTSISPFRLTLSISYIKLLGYNFYKNLIALFGLPEIIYFDSHLHDFIICEDSYSKLPLFWKFIYGRNRSSGIEYCIKFLQDSLAMGYRPCFMSELYESQKKILAAQG